MNEPLTAAQLISALNQLEDAAPVYLKIGDTLYGVEDVLASLRNAWAIVIPSNVSRMEIRENAGS